MRTLPHLIVAILLATPALAQEPTAPQASDPTPQASDATEPTLDPAVVTWYQDMRLACNDKRTSLVARHQGSQRTEPAALFGQSVWSDMARSGLVSWQAAGDPRVNDKTLARTPEPAGHHSIDSRSSTAAPQLYDELPAELTGKIQGIELAQAKADTSWRAWQTEPSEDQREALVAALELLQRLCTKAD